MARQPEVLDNYEPTSAQTLREDPYSYFGVKFWSAYDRVQKHQGAMSEGEWQIIKRLEMMFRRLDPGVENIMREKTALNPGRPRGVKVVGGKEVRP